MQRRTPPRVVYRVVRHDPPEREDFLPPALAGALGRGTRAVDPRILEGISVLATMRQALALARRYPGLGSFVAEIQLPEETVIERTLRRRGHYTVWAEPDQLLRLVRRVVSVT